MSLAYPPLFENKILLVPSSPSTHEFVKAAQVLGKSDFNIMVDREMISLTGFECDKVGTFYKAFQN